MNFSLIYMVWMCFYGFEQIPPSLPCSGGAGQYQRLAATAGCGLLSYPPGVGHGGWVHQPALQTTTVDATSKDRGAWLAKDIWLKLLYSVVTVKTLHFSYSGYLATSYPSNSFLSYDAHEAIVESIGHLLSAEGLVAWFGPSTLAAGRCDDNVSLKSFLIFFEHLFWMPKGKDVVSSYWCWKLTVFGCFKVSSNKRLMMEVALRQKVGFWWSMWQCES